MMVVLFQVTFFRCQLRFWLNSTIHASPVFGEHIDIAALDLGTFRAVFRRQSQPVTDSCPMGEEVRIGQLSQFRVSVHLP
jgi:hypothetical protein